MKEEMHTLITIVAGGLLLGTGLVIIFALLLTAADCHPIPTHDQLRVWVDQCRHDCLATPDLTPDLNQQAATGVADCTVACALSRALEGRR
jgi:hypothetical protein